MIYPLIDFTEDERKFLELVFKMADVALNGMINSNDWMGDFTPNELYNLSIKLGIDY